MARDLSKVPSHTIRKLWSFIAPKRRTKSSFIRSIFSGSVLKPSDIRNGESSITDIRTKIDAMRDLAKDSQIATALSYYATDATTTNSVGQIVWASSDDKNVADIINALFDKYKVNNYVRDHILELATVGNYYMPTTLMYKSEASSTTRYGVALDNNTIADDDFDIVPGYKVAPEDILHIWSMGEDKGYIYQPDEDVSDYIMFPKNAVIHFSLGGLLGEYTITGKDQYGNEIPYDIQFAEPLLSGSLTPTTTLNLLEDASVIAALVRIVKFINVDCSGAEEEEIPGILQQIKDAIGEQFSMSTLSGDAQSFLNPQSPNNLVYLPKVNGQDAISITDLNMAENNEANNALLDYYQNKKLSTLGIPKEAFNYSSNEGLGGAGSVMSQRSALYANILDRLMTAYKNGWKDAIDAYFENHNMSGYIGRYELHMNPIITTQSTIQFDKRDAALNQATTVLQILKDAGVENPDKYVAALTEILSEVFPKMGSDIADWGIKTSEENSEGGGMNDF